MIEAVTKGLSGYRAAARKLHEGVDRLRDVRLRLIEERTALVRTPGDRDEAIQALDAGLDALAAEAVATMSATGLTATGGGKLPAFDPCPGHPGCLAPAGGHRRRDHARGVSRLGLPPWPTARHAGAALTSRLIDARIDGAKTPPWREAADLAPLDATSSPPRCGGSR